MLLPLRRQDGIAHLVPIVLLAVVSVVVIVGVAVQQYESQKRASQEQQQAAKDAKLSADAKAAKATPTPAPTATPAVTPTATPVATPAPTPKPANIKHPTQANCNNKSFTVYASVVGGTPEYYEANTSSKIYRRVAYGQAITVVCDPSWSVSGWMLSGNSQVRFQDASLIKP